MSLSHHAMSGSRPDSREGASFMARYPALQSAGEEATWNGRSSYEGSATSPSRSLSQLNSENAAAAEGIEFYKMIVPPNAGTGAATKQHESMIFAAQSEGLALQDATRSTVSSRQFTENFGKDPKKTDANAWFPQRAPRSAAPNFMMMRFASRKSKLSKLNRQAKQVMTGSPVSRHIPGTAFDPSEGRPMANSSHSNDISVPKPTRVGSQKPGSERDCPASFEDGHVPLFAKSSNGMGPFRSVFNGKS